MGTIQLFYPCFAWPSWVRIFLYDFYVACEVKVVQAKDLRQQNSAGVHQRVAHHKMGRKTLDLGVRGGTHRACPQNNGFAENPISYVLRYCTFDLNLLPGPWIQV
jgi:hypothetical protein